MTGFRRSRVLSGLAIALVLLLVIPAGVVGATSLSVLRYANTGAKDAYRLKLAKTSEWATVSPS